MECAWPCSSPSVAMPRRNLATLLGAHRTSRGAICEHDYWRKRATTPTGSSADSSIHSLYFVENKLALRSDYQRHWDDFLTALLVPLNRDSWGALCRYVNQLNDAFNLLRASLQSSDQRR